MLCSMQVHIKMHLADAWASHCNARSPSALTIHTKQWMVLLQAKADLQGMLTEAEQTNSDLSLQSLAKQEELKKADDKAAGAEQQRAELQQQLEALKETLTKANADHEKASQICLPVSDYPLDCFIWAQHLSHVMPGFIK